MQAYYATLEGTKEIAFYHGRQHGAEAPEMLAETMEAEREGFREKMRGAGLEPVEGFDEVYEAEFRRGWRAAREHEESFARTWEEYPYFRAGGPSIIRD
jgi:DNA-binding LacI/PurR family transcriptional regulator